MKVSVTYHVSDLARRGISLTWGKGEDRPATREEIRLSLLSIGDTYLDDMAQVAFDRDAEAAQKEPQP